MQRKNSLDICLSDKDLCPCRILIDSIPYCNFINSIGYLYLHKKLNGAEELLSKICREMKSLWLEEEFISNRAREQGIKFLNRVKLGEKVYCISEMADVIFLEKPANEFGKCKYKTLDGKIKTQWSFCFKLKRVEKK